MGESLEITKPRIGISRCLLGENVRYNKGHKLDHYLKYTFGQFVEFVPVCPEIEAGMGVPREAVNLNEIDGKIYMLGEKSKTDFTEQMNNWIDKEIEKIKSMNLCGFILKSKSPSCGVFRTRLYRDNKPPSLNHRGFFADAIITNFPMLLVEEEGRLHDPIIRDNFVERVFINFRWMEIIKKPTVDKLMKFHQSLKYTLMAHSPKLQKDLGVLVAASTKENIYKEYSEYYLLLTKCLSEYSNKKKNRNVLDHIMGYFKKDLTKDEKKELKEVIDNYYQGLLPLIVPVTLLNHYTNKYNSDYLKGQFFLNPHPLELMLRNNV